MTTLKFELVDAWKKVAVMSWAARLGVLAAVLQALAEFQDQLPTIRDYVPHGVFSLLAILCAISVPLARIVKQQSVADAVKEATSAATIADVHEAVQVVKHELDAHTAPPPAPVTLPKTLVADAYTAPPPVVLMNKTP